MQGVVILHTVECAGIAMGDVDGGFENGFQQAVEVLLPGKRHANRVEFFETLQEVIVA